MNLVSFFLALTATLFGSLGSIFIKLGSSLVKDVKTLIFNKRLFLGALLFVFSVIFTTFALKYEDLSIVYPLTSLSYIWVILFSSLFLKESINKYKVMGILLVIFGVVLISMK